MPHLAKPMSVQLARVAAGVALAVAASTAIASHASLSPQSVTLLADRFTFEEWTSGDLELLASTLRATQPSFVELYACGPDTYRTLLAAAHTLSDLPLVLQVMPRTDMHCSAAPAAPAATRSAAAPDDTAVARYWQQVMP
jgi:hypothetical protein